MRQVTIEELSSPAATLDPEVVEFRSEFGQTSPLDELVRHGAQQMLQSAIEMEVDDFLSASIPFTVNFSENTCEAVSIRNFTLYY